MKLNLSQFENRPPIKTLTEYKRKRRKFDYPQRLRQRNAHMSPTSRRGRHVGDMWSTCSHLGRRSISKRVGETHVQAIERPPFLPYKIEKTPTSIAHILVYQSAHMSTTCRPHVDYMSTTSRQPKQVGVRWALRCHRFGGQQADSGIQIGPKSNSALG